MVDFISRDPFVLTAVDATERRVRLKIEHFAEDLSLVFYVELTLGHIP